MTPTYVIEPERDGSWVMRRFGVHHPVATAPTLEELREPAFLSAWEAGAPCRVEVWADPKERWACSHLPDAGT